MGFNAQNLKLEIKNILNDYPVSYQRDIINLKELEEILDKLTATGIGYNLNYIKRHEIFIRANAIETEFVNGMKFFDSIIVYQDRKKNTNFLRQFMIHENSSDDPIIYLGINEKKVSFLQFLLSGTINKNICSNSENDINIETTTIYIRDQYSSVFTKYTNTENDALLIEKCKFTTRKNNTDTANNIVAKNIFNFLYGGNRELEFSYQDNKPICIQTSDNCENCQEYLNHSQQIWDIINQELLEISNSIRDVIQKNDSEYQKLVKKKERILLNNH